jgi:urease accessory protein
MLAQAPSHAPTTDPLSPAGHQRSEGEAEIAFALRQGRSTLAHLYQRAPCRVLFPAAAVDDLAEAVLVTTSGGIAGGDRLRIAVSVEAGAAALVTSQAAEKIYRSLGPEARCAVSLQVGDGAWLEWLPQETILFQAARFSRSIEAKLAPTGRLLASEIVVFGRLARGERFSSGRLHDRWRLHRDGRLAWADAVCLEGCPGGEGTTALDEPLAFSGARAMATVVYAGPDAARHLALARSLTGAARCRAGATLVNGTLLARFLAEDPGRLRADLAGYVAELRHAAAQLPARPPRLWQF